MNHQDTESRVFTLLQSIRRASQGFEDAYAVAEMQGNNDALTTEELQQYGAEVTRALDKLKFLIAKTEKTLNRYDYKIGALVWKVFYSGKSQWPSLVSES